MEELRPEDIQDLWHRFDEHSPIVYETTHEEYTAHEYIAGIVEDMAAGLSIQDSDDFWDLLDYLGITYSDFPWEEFREWYDSLG